MVKETLLAVGGCTGSCESGTTAFWDSGIGNVLGALLAVIGVVVVIVAVVKGFGKVTSGKVGDAAKIGIGAAIFAAFLFNPQMLGDLIGVFSTLAKTVIDSFGDVVDSSGGGAQ